MTRECQARADRHGVMRCAVCRVAWDRDDEPPACPRQAPPVEPGTLQFASGLPEPTAYFR